MDRDIENLEARLKGLLAQQEKLQRQLGMHNGQEKTGARSRDTPWSFSGSRAVQARAKRSERARLDQVNRQIEKTRRELSRYLDSF